MMRLETHPWQALAWYVVHVAPRAERKAADDLDRAGIASFVPTSTVWRRKRRMGIVHADWRQITRPLFPGYMLVGIASPADWQAVRGCDGYGYTVSAEGAPLRIPALDVIALAARVDSGEFDQDHRPKRGRDLYRPGDRVLVSVAGMVEAPAVVTEARANAVFVELLESGRRARAALEHVRAAG